MDDRHNVETPQQPQSKKAYVSPKLENYGSVSNIAAGSAGSKADAGTQKA